jgi:glycosyltransferase involved in cell wall biosynthesis
MKKVLLVTDFFYPHWTGISKSLYYTTQKLSSQLDFTVITVQHNSDLPKQEKLGKVKVVRKKYLFKLSRTMYSFSILTAMLKSIKDCDVVLINSPCSNVLFASIIAKLFKKRLVIFHQGDLILPKSLINSFLEFIFNNMSLIAFALADELATFTQDYAQHSRLLPRFKNKAQGILPPLPYFEKNQSQFQPDKKLKSNLDSINKKSALTIGFAGRFVQEKGFDILLKAARIILNKKINLQLVFAGETQIAYEDTFGQSQELIAAVENNLHFLGLLNDNQLVQFYQNIDVFVLSSRSECFGLVQAEAMSQKTLVIAPNIPGARDPVKKTGFGLLFQPENPESLAEKILELHSNLSKFKKNHSPVIKYFDPDKHAQDFCRFIAG